MGLVCPETKTHGVLIVTFENANGYSHVIRVGYFAGKIQWTTLSVAEHWDLLTDLRTIDFTLGSDDPDILEFGREIAMKGDVFKQTVCDKDVDTQAAFSEMLREQAAGFPPLAFTIETQ